MSVHIWLRSETKPAEKRTVLPPQHAQQLVAAGFQLTVEESSQSVFDANEYQSAGCEIVSEHSWKQLAPEDAIILGLKELETSDQPLHHRHIHFAHIYKNQSGWKETISRFETGGGRLFDLEFLVDDNARRIAAFGRWAGFAGAGLSILAWTNQQRSITPVLDTVTARTDAQSFIEEIRGKLQGLDKPKVMVIGSLGRCGRGAIELLEAVDAEVVGWDLAETQRGGPFDEILECNLFLNCVFIERQIPPFITREMLQTSTRKLNVICDVSCDPYGDYNPIPIYDQCTTFENPVLNIVDGENPINLIAIDHLPSLLPRESSEDFCDQLIPFLLQLDSLDARVWKRAGDLFDSKLAAAQADSN